MTQNYKVFIGDSVLHLAETPEQCVACQERYRDPEPEKWPELIAGLEQQKKCICIYGDTARNWSAFSSHYRLIEAAGGLVRNCAGKWLLIHRNGVWDLPKGKREKGESVEQCAVREVAEECGITEPSIIRALRPTYHTYMLNGQRILKRTFWFLMESSDPKTPSPQQEEGITEAKWATPDDALKLTINGYGSIREVLHEGLN